jgi:predicted Zn-dependent protease
MRPTRLVVLPVLTGLLLLAGCGYFQGPEKRVARAEQYLAQGEHRRALIELRNAIQSEPDLPAARLLLAEIALWFGDAAGAERELKRVTAGYEPARSADLALRIDLAAGRLQDVLERVGTPAAGAPASAWLYRGQALQMLGRWAESEAAFRQALAADPKLLAARAGLVECRAAQGDGAGALALTQAMTGEHPDASLAWFMHGALLARTGAMAEAAEALDRATADAQRQLDIPRQVALYGTLIEVQIANGKHAEARAAADRLTRTAPNTPLASIFSARVAIVTGEYANATGELRRLLNVRPQFARARFLLGVALAAQGNLEQASQELRLVVDQMPENLEARQLLAQLRLRLEDPAGAMLVLVPALEANAEDRGLNLLFEEARLQDDSAGKSLGWLESEYRKSPDNRGLRLQLASAYLGGGQAAKALALLQPLEGARESDVAADRLLLAAIADTQGEAAANRKLEQLLAARPADTALSVLAAQSRLAAGDARGAHELLAAAVRRAPADDSVRLALARVDIARGDRAAAVAGLEALRKGGTRATEARLLLAQLALQRDDAKLADQLIAEAVSGGPNAADTRNTAGAIYLSTGRYDAAAEHFRAGTQADPTDARLWLNLGRAQLALEQFPGARDSLERALKLRRHWLPAEGVMAFLEMQQGHGEAAVARVEALARARPDDPAARVLESEVYAAQRRFAEAERALDTALKLRPSASLAVKAYQLRLASERADATEPLADWLARQPDDAPVRRLMAEAHVRAGARQRAVEQYELLLSREPGDVVALNNLAWLYFELGDRRAAATARRAYELAPDSPAVGDTLGWILVQQGRVADGLPLLEKAAGQVPGDGDMQYRHAAALARSGRNAEAEARLRAVLATVDHFASRQEAEQLLAELGKGPVSAR